MKEKIIKRPLTKQEIYLLENHSLPVERLAAVRDLFVFQCYTGLAFIDVYNLKKTDIKPGDDGQLWIRRTFGRTVTLNNNVPIYVVKEILGHQSVKQTEEYTITEQVSIGREMKELQERLHENNAGKNDTPADDIFKMQEEIISLRKQLGMTNDSNHNVKSVLRVCR